MPGVYTPSATDSTRPADNDDAFYAAAELRTLKAYVATLNTSAAAASAAAAAASASSATAASTQAINSALLLGANTTIQYCGLATGTANTIRVFPPLTVLTQIEGQEFTFVAAYTSTIQTPTLQVSSLTPITLDTHDERIIAGEEYKVIIQSGATTAKIYRIYSLGTNNIPVPLDYIQGLTMSVLTVVGAICSFSGTTMTCTTAGSAAVVVGDSVVASGVPQGTYITAIPGGGGVGTYTISRSIPVIASETVHTVRGFNGYNLAVNAGAALDSTGTVMLYLKTPLYKTTAAWAVGTGVGGLDTGTISGGASWYYWYLIRRPDTGVVDTIFSLSPYAPALPTGYTQYRYIGATRFFGAPGWLGFTQVDRDFMWYNPILDASFFSVSSTAVTLALTVPQGRKCYAYLTVLAAAATTIYVSDPAAAGGSGAIGNIVYPGSGVSSYTDGVGAIRIVSTTSTTVNIYNLGYRDLALS
jgi:hypothetical protein